MDDTRLREIAAAHGTAHDRKLQGRIGALRMHAAGKTNTGPARAAFQSRFERDVDPNGALPDAERKRRADLARRAFYSELALKSARARRKRSAQARTPAV